MWENTDQKNSEYGHFSRSDHRYHYTVIIIHTIITTTTITIIITLVIIVIFIFINIDVFIMNTFTIFSKEAFWKKQKIHSYFSEGTTMEIKSRCFFVLSLPLYHMTDSYLLKALMFFLIYLRMKYCNYIYLYISIVNTKNISNRIG